MSFKFTKIEKKKNFQKNLQKLMKMNWIMNLVKMKR